MTFEVKKDQWTKFETFFNISQNRTLGTTNVTQIPVAAGLDLRASFARGTNFFPPLQTGHYHLMETREEIPIGTAEPDGRFLKEEVLLNYFFALEALAGEQIRVGVGSKTSTNPAEKIAFIIGGDGAERVGF